MQIPLGVEAGFTGVINLLEQDAWYFEDKVGSEPRITAVPEEYREEVALRRAVLVERIAELDDTLTEKFLLGEPIELEELKAALRRGVLDNKVVPVFCGSSLRNKGVQLVLDAVVDYLPSPLDIPPVQALWCVMAAK